MKDPENDLLLDHEADGIRELDNKLPRWWVWLFYGSIAFAIVYLLYYHTNAAPLLTGGALHKGESAHEEYLREMRIGQAIKSNAMSRFEASIPSLAPSRDPVVLERGKDIFLNLCAPCHRKDGGGLVGPNLTGDHWIHGSNFTDNVTTIWNGVPAKGMITWKKTLKPDQVMSVASYIYTLRGTHPPNPKPPEGTSAPAAPSIFE